MTFSFRHAPTGACFGVFALFGFSYFAQVHAQDSASQGDQGSSDIESVIVTSDRNATRSSVDISGVEAQKILPGISPLKAIETLPGVVYESADPWGNNEQNESLVIHGFTTQQLGYTLDGVPLGDQQYGNYNGLSPSRAITRTSARSSSSPERGL